MDDGLSAVGILAGIIFLGDALLSLYQLTLMGVALKLTSGPLANNEPPRAPSTPRATESRDEVVDQPLKPVLAANASASSWVPGFLRGSVSGGSGAA